MGVICQNGREKGDGGGTGVLLGWGEGALWHMAVQKQAMWRQ